MLTKNLREKKELEQLWKIKTHKKEPPPLSHTDVCLTTVGEDV